VQYFGYILSEQGLTTTPEKVKAVQQYPTPKNVMDVRAFLGLASLYRRLVPNFAQIAKHLTVLTRKDQEFTWGPKQHAAFECMKEKLFTPTVLDCQNFELSFILSTGASQTTFGAILSQVQNGVARPIGYASRQKNKAEQSCSASETKILALVWATKYIRCYILGRRFLVRTDHAALTYLQKFAYKTVVCCVGAQNCPNWTLWYSIDLVSR
jgi:hypothetical protein